jgi:hypothetical protein
MAKAIFYPSRQSLKCPWCTAIKLPGLNNLTSIIAFTTSMKTQGRRVHILASMAMLYLQSLLPANDVFEPENNAPTDITLSADSIPENEKKRVYCWHPVRHR